MPPRRNAKPNAEGRGATKAATQAILEELSRPSPFTVLGINAELLDRITDDEELVIVARGMYRALSTIYHPDQGGDANDFSAIKTALDEITENPSGERTRLLSTTKTTRGKRAVTTKTGVSVGGGNRVQGASNLPVESKAGDAQQIDRYYHSFLPESVQHIASAEFLLIPSSVYKSDMRAPAQYGTFSRGEGIRLGKIPDKINRHEINTEEAAPYKSLFEACTDDAQTHFVRTIEGEIFVAQANGERVSAGFDDSIDDGWFDIGGTGDSRSITTIETPRTFKTYPSLELFGVVMAEDADRYLKYRAANARVEAKMRSAAHLDALEEGEIEVASLTGSAAKERAANLFDQRFLISQREMKGLIANHMPYIRIDTLVNTGDLLIARDTQKDTGIMLGKIQAQLVDRDF